MKLGINIDHIATLREARKEKFPDPIEAAKEALAGGADGIVCHLREDRRHINDDDVKRLRKLNCRLDLEMAATDEMVRIACKLKPEMVTLVPEKRQEVTTEGGLDINLQLQTSNFQTISKIQKIQSKKILVSLFVDPESRQIKAAAESGAEFIELHTGRFCRTGAVRDLQKLVKAVKLAQSLGLKVNAGHGLDYHNVAAMKKIPGLVELNIGFSVIARAVTVGLRQAVKEMREAMQ